ncbi:lytic transglycosylase domain-containing protein [Lentzea sp. NPDC058450]|uniref:lytic transglycosylase domain-containing protein n=1 Tax=Lentzea sp. NPDC058450 TaxID=3346505 RepID=UPI003657AB1C
MGLALALTVLTAAGASTLEHPAAETEVPRSPDEGPRTALSSADWFDRSERMPNLAPITERPAPGAIALAAASTPTRSSPVFGPLLTPVAGSQGIPANVLAAYQAAAELMAKTSSRCNLPWHLLASIGRIESGHARGGRADAAGTTSPAILGPVLSGGPGIAAIRDTDGGRWDGDAAWDRAVGPMQFIPGTWAHYGTDGNGDRIVSPHNVFDAAASAAKYLCSGGMDLSRPGDLRAAVFRYNHSESYVRTVIAWSEAYATGTRVVPAALVGHVVDQTARPPAPAAAPAAPKPAAETVAALPAPATTTPAQAPRPAASPTQGTTPTTATSSAKPEPAVTTQAKPEPPKRPAWTDASAAFLKVCLKFLSRGHKDTPAHAKRCAATVEEAIAAGVITEEEVEAAKQAKPR